ncbi:MAG: hypothetical protein ABFE07_15510 [Armatimonadia bacterium]
MRRKSDGREDRWPNPAEHTDTANWANWNHRTGEMDVWTEAWNSEGTKYSSSDHITIYMYDPSDPTVVPTAVGRGSTNRERLTSALLRNGGLPNVGASSGDVHSWDTVPECQDFTGGAGLADQIQWNRYTNQAYWMHGSHWRKYSRWLLSAALSDAWRVGDMFFRTCGVRQDFQWGSMYCADGAEAWKVYGDDHWVKFKSFGGIYSFLGWPTSEPYDNGSDVWQAFEGGWGTRDAGVRFAADKFPVPVTDLDVIAGTHGNNGSYRSPVRIHLQPNVPSIDR